MIQIKLVVSLVIIMECKNIYKLNVQTIKKKDKSVNRKKEKNPRNNVLAWEDNDDSTSNSSQD